MRAVVRRMIAPGVACALGLLAAFGATAQQAPSGTKPASGEKAVEAPVVVLMVKPGDPGATEELAKDFLALFGDVLARQVRAFAGREVVVRLTNDSAHAAEHLGELDPDLILCPPGFHLQHLRPLAKPDPDPEKRRAPATPLLEIPRFEHTTEQYCLVVHKGSETQRLEDLQGLRVSMTGAVDWPWMQRLVFPASFDPREKLRLAPAKNLADDVFDLLDRLDTAPSALLLDREMRRFFENDEFVWPELRVIWTSPELPRHLVVARGSAWTDEQRKTIVDDFEKIGATESGQKLLKLIDSKGFRRLDAKRWALALKKYFPKAEPEEEGGR